MFIKKMNRNFFVHMFILVVLMLPTVGRGIALAGSDNEGAQKAQPKKAIPRKREAQARNEEGAKTASRKVRYPVSRFALSYRYERGGHLSLEELHGVKIELGRVDGGLGAPGKGTDKYIWTVGDPPAEPKMFYPGGIRAVCNQLVEAFKDRGYLGVYVMVSTEDIGRRTGKDRRGKDKTLHLVVHTTQVGNVRTIASGERVDEENRIDSPVHERIRTGSPVQPGDLLRIEDVSDYIYSLNRHPGRNVDMAVSAGDEPGQAVLDYMVAENKPWMAYFQLNNTGTESTDEWRQRFGLTHRQLTGRDDILRLDYVTATFDEVNALVGSYQIPVKWLYSDLRVYGSWNEYTASEVGRAKDAFEGEGWHAGTELTWNIYQNGPLFIDVLGGARYEHTRVQNNLFGVEGKTDFLLPYVGIELERQTRLARTGASVDIEYNLASWAGTDEDELPRLGRLNVDKRWTVAHWNAYQSFFLEPIIFGKEFKDVESPESSTLAHEMFFEFKGQYSFSNRLVPQAQMVAGGMHTVRGYPESAVAGDDVYIARGEYRLHIPRVLRPNPSPPEVPLLGRPFRVAPQHTFGYPDWDLQLKAFVDWARVENSDRLSYETDDDLLGAGLGVELQILSNLNAKLEWGQALRDLDSEGVERGDDEIHFSLTLMY